MLLHTNVPLCGRCGEDGVMELDTTIVERVAALSGSMISHGLARGSMIAVAIADGVGAGFATVDRQWAMHAAQPAEVVRAIESALRPRWIWWNSETASVLIRAGLRVATCWDVAAVHRVLFGGWRAEPAMAWAALHGLGADAIPGMGQLDLLTGSGDDGTDFDDPVRPDRHLRPEWVSGLWSTSPERLARWATVAVTACDLQRTRLAELEVGGDPAATARSESATEMLCAELQIDGLPIDVAVAESIIGAAAGERPGSEKEAAQQRASRDAAVLEHAPLGGDRDLRNPAHVKALLGRVGIDVTSTRAWRLEPFREANPFVDALLTWRKAERISTTYGYAWLASHVGSDGRLRGAWTGCDGAAGRMTALAGLHNLPAEMRPAIVAEPGHVFVRADLGQIEPRVLAAVSGDPALANATAADDLYAPIAKRLGVERPIAKVAVLAAMYGQTSGAAGQALRGLEAAYPVAMRYLCDADESGQAGTDIRTFGGRLIRMSQTTDGTESPSAVAGRGRFARNAVVQGAAAELFKAWAVIVRARIAWTGAIIVLCLHDELLVHVPAEHGSTVARLLDDCLQEASQRWAPAGNVRFVADTGIIQRWSDAKP